MERTEDQCGRLVAKNERLSPRFALNIIIYMGSGGKLLEKLWCCVNGQHHKKIWGLSTELIV